jgi:hypothetical protein
MPNIRHCMTASFAWRGRIYRKMLPGSEHHVAGWEADAFLEESD